MSTLHICHWHSFEHLNSHLKLIFCDDSLLIFGDLSSSELLKVKDWSDNNNINWHLVIDEASPHITERAINHDQWLELINQHDNCFAWK